MHCLGQRKAVFLLKDERGTALARLAVYPDNAFVLPPDVVRVDKQVGNIPQCILRHFCARRHSLADGILVAAAECSKDKLPGIGRARVDFHTRERAVLLRNTLNVAEVKLRVNALREQVERDVHHVKVTGALTVTENAAFRAVSSGKQCKFRGSNALAAVIVAVRTDNHTVTVADMPGKIFNLVCIDIRRCTFHRRRQVQDNLVFRRTAPLRLYRLTDFYGIVNFGHGKTFRRIFKADTLAVLFAQAGFYAFDAVNGKLLNLFLCLPEGVLALRRRRGIVDVENGLGSALQALNGLLHQLFACLAEHLNGHIVGDAVLLDKTADEFVLGVACSGEADFNFLETDFYQQAKERKLCLYAHRIHKRLVSVAKVNGTPQRCLGNLAGRPFAVFQRNVGNRGILAFRIHNRHKKLLFDLRGSRIFFCTFKTKRPAAEATGLVISCSNENNTTTRRPIFGTLMRK